MDEQRTAIVTGGTHGIGRACTEVLARDGHRVVFAGRDAVAGAEVQAAVPDSQFVPADVTDPLAVERLVATALECGGGRIDALVNNAGTVNHGPFDEGDVADWDHHMNVNARSVYLVTRRAIDGLKAASGSVVTIASIAGSAGWPGLSAYTASKAALIALTQTLAIEQGEKVRFNCVCPGEIATRLMEEELADPELRAKIVKSIPAARIGEPAEIAEVVGFLISPRSSFVNGAVIPVDGGETAGFGPR
jgi:3-oxoacyl-[acyl-carrier protein] reductase